MSAEAPALRFDVPGGTLVFARDELDPWAEHLTWCYRFLGVGRGATLAVQDFGSSAVSFLGSALLMPGLERGVAERLGGRFLGLDASPERVLLTPSVLEQVNPDALVVRDAVLPLLEQHAAERGEPLDREGRVRVVVRDRLGRETELAPGWRELLHVEAALLLAPRCEACGSYHLRAGIYAVEDGAVVNRRAPWARKLPLSPPARVADGPCERGPEDLRLDDESPAGGDA